MNPLDQTFAHSPGKSIRLSRLFDDASGRTVIVAVDHGQDHGVQPGLENMGATLAALREAGPDALLLRPSMLKRYHRLLQGKGAPALIVGLDSRWTQTVPLGPELGEEHELLVSVEEAARLGADAVKILLIFGRNDIGVHAKNVKAVAKVIEASEKAGIPVMVEPTLWGLGIPKEAQNDPERVPHIARIAFELGADILKLPYAPGVFGEITEALPVPITILGGPKADSESAFWAMVEQAVSEGVRGVAFGRNVWQAADVRKQVERLKAIVHG